MTNEPNGQWAFLDWFLPLVVGLVVALSGAVGATAYFYGLDAAAGHICRQQGATDGRWDNTHNVPVCRTETTWNAK